jgi:hypothetical protein
MAIEGYTGRTSVAAGGGIGFHVDNTPATPDATVRLTIARLGATTPLALSATFTTGHHPTPSDAFAAGCGWPLAYVLAVPREWPSGFYAATLTNADGDATVIHFVVRARAPGSESNILLCIPVTTFQAYNEWGGNSLYGTPTAERSRKVSFDRPGGTEPSRPGRLIQWLARHGIAVELCTSVDLHSDPSLLRSYRVFVSSGHDEYWTREMRDHVEGFLADGGNAAFFSGDVAFWQARLEDDGRTLVCYRDALEDPLLGVDDSRVTVRWAIPPVNRPENTMTGVGSRSGAGNWVVEGAWRSAEYTVNFPEHWVFEGTGLALGQTFGRGSVGYETDAADIVFECGVARATGRDGAPPTFVVLAVADLRRWRIGGQGGYATMGIHRGVGTVFTAASVDWADTLATSPAVERITGNVLRRLSAPPAAQGWEPIGDASGVVAMAAFENRIFGVTRDGALYARDPVGQNVAWRPIGVVEQAIAISSCEAVTDRPAGLFLVTHGGRLLFREPVLTEVLPDPVGSAVDIVSIAAGGVDLFGITRDGHLVVRPMAGDDLPWETIGDAQGVVILGTEGRKLWGVGAEGRLLWREPVRRPAPWTELAHAAEIVALAGSGGMLYAATRGGTLLWRDPYVLPTR